jgi:hypothetical protein
VCDKIRINVGPTASAKGGGQVANSRFWKQFALAIVVSMVAVTIVWLLASLISPDIRVDTPTEDNARLKWWGPALGMIFPYGLGALIAALLLIQFRRPRIWWYVIAVIALIAVGAQAFAQANTNESAIWLNVMHLAAAAVIVPVVARFLPER